MRTKDKSNRKEIIDRAAEILEAQRVEESGGLIISYAKDREPVSVEILSASRRGLIDPKQTTFPITSTKS